MKISKVVFLSVFCFSGILLAAEESISVKAEVDRAVLTIGERVEYRVTVAHDPSLEIISKIVPPPSEAFEVKEVHDVTEKQGKQIVEGRKFSLVLYNLGEFILEPVTVRYRNAKGEEKSIETNRLYLTVRSVDESGTPKTDIRGVKGTLSLRANWLWVWVLLLMMILAGGGWVAWQRFRKGPGGGEGTSEPPLSPEDEALLALNRLFDSDFLSRGKLKEYYLTLSEILKRYFERRFEILALESTTPEILALLRQKEISSSLFNKIREVLEWADLVKFAKFRPAPSEIIKVNQRSKALIEEARPQVSPPLEETPTQSPHGV